MILMFFETLKTLMLEFNLTHLPMFLGAHPEPGPGRSQVQPFSPVPDLPGGWTDGQTDRQAGLGGLRADEALRLPAAGAPVL